MKIAYSDSEGRFTRMADLPDFGDVVAEVMSWPEPPDHINLAVDVGFFTHYFDGNVVVARPDLDSLSNVESGNVWVADSTTVKSYGPNLPNPTTYRITSYPSTLSLSNVSGTETDGEFALTTVTAGDYTIELESWPYLKKTLTWRAE